MISPLSMTRFSNSVYFSQSTALNSSSETISSVNDKRVNDTVSISNEAMSASLRSKMNPLRNFPSTLEEISESLKDDTAYVEKALRNIYEKHRISEDTEFKISSGGDGSIIVSGDNQKADEVAEAINNDPELSNTIRRMSANTSLLNAIKVHMEFSKAYEEDPEAAVREFAYLFETGHSWNTSFTMSKGSVHSEVKYVLKD